MKNKIHHEVLGMLEESEDSMSYESNIELPNGKTVNVSVLTPDLEDILHLCSRSFHFIKKNQSHIKNQIAKEMLKLHNEVWNETDRELSSAEFVNEIELEEVHFYEDEDSILIELYYDDGNLFGGHVIVADVDTEGVVTRTDIYG